MREEVIREALSWVGTPFVRGQAVKGAGVDCAYFVFRVYQACGLIDPSLPLPPIPPEGWFHNVKEDGFLIIGGQWFERVSGPPEMADVLTFAGRVWPVSGHCGIYDGNGHVIHAAAGRGVEVWPFPGSDLLRRTHRYTLRYRAWVRSPERP